ncbi:nucleoside monophosphate kinase [Dehalogenimonas etheniformans]|uniref:Adenylate kinase n=1 Tax=Dehalogenimonas etheniformans TaxID=1536648 RepID=A0A2P5P5P9_9CHLR|nr:nucleoside monophosphate kinase [Dehalogenimonas etheniformans]PPD57614.1 hypothetical protein JP09_007670 [Dehalogenimonas etheniformans]QNT75954.1 nucleoside monophosphate kinase [Dehalogenimonas etheniformans]
MDENQSEYLPNAILLLGPTGSGKTPLGDLLENEGLAGRKCFHFDFGAQLRGYAANPTDLLSEVELEIVKISLGSGALLTDSQFGIAEKLLGEFIEKNRIGSGDLIIMNGMPRHAGQAAGLERIIKMKAVVVLGCDAATVRERICTNAGGDREGRVDDTKEDVVRKLAIFAEKTLPLLKFYEGYGIPVIHIDVGTNDSAIKSRGALVVKITNIFD